MGIREKLHLGLHQPEPPADPNRPHPFKRAGDAWIGHGVPPSNTVSGPDSTMVGAVIAGLQFGDQHCAVCRRGHDDPIHALAED
jgi:hypothetical protein